MKRITISMIAAVFMLVCGDAGDVWAAEPQPPDVDIWTAAGTGNTEAMNQHVSAGTDLNAKEPGNGGTPLIVAAAYGQTEAARLLVKNGAELEARNNDGATALLVASFFCHLETVKFLLENGAEVNAKNNIGQTPLDIVAGEWSPELAGLYEFFGAILQTELDLEEIKSMRPVVADILRGHGGKAAGESATEAESPVGLKGSYAVNGELHVNTFGTPEGKPITTGHQDMKPSWSKTGGMLVFFRVTEFAREVPDWKTAICVVNVDGTGFHKLTDGTHTDFNPTWTRDGSNLPIFNRQKKTGGYVVMQSKAGNRPGDEVAISDPRYHTYAYSCLEDGRIFVSSSRTPGGYFLMTPGREGRASYEPIQCALAKKGLLDRVSISPGETKVCFEFQKGFASYRYPGRTLYITDFDAQARTVTNPVPIANEASDRGTLYLYPRWTKDESAVVYHCNKTGKNQLYMYRLEDGSTVRVSTNSNANYMFPHGEESPK